MESSKFWDVAQQALAILIAAAISTGVVGGVSSWFAVRAVGDKFVEHSDATGNIHNHLYTRLDEIENAFNDFSVVPERSAAEDRRLEGVLSECKAIQKEVLVRLHQVEMFVAETRARHNNSTHGKM